MCSDAPDTSGMNAAAVSNAELGKEQAAIAREQMAKAEARQAKFDPQFQAVLDASLKSQQTQDQRSAEQWQQYLKIGMPAEQRLADTAANYDTPERRAEAAAAAGAAVEQQGSSQREAQTRALGRAGISLGSGRALTLDNASRLQQTKATVGAQQAARDKVEATGMSLTDNVAKFGRGLTSTGLQAAQLALGAGSATGGTLGQQQSTYGASLAPTFQAYGGAASANSSAGNLFGNVAQLQQQGSNSTMQSLMGLGQLAGTFLSSKELKTRIGPVSGKHARRLLEGSVVDRWKYKPGVADEGEHIGRYAEDIPGGPMGGKAVDVISEMGLHHAAISDLSKEVQQISRRLSLGDTPSRALAPPGRMGLGDRQTSTGAQ